MARNLTAGFINACTAANNAPFIMFEGVFSSSTINLWNGAGDLSWSSRTWLGNGWFQALEGGDESSEVEALDMTVVLSGVPSAVISLVLSEQMQNARGDLYIGFLDSSGAIIADPYLWWRGYFSHAEIDEAPTDSLVKLYYDSPLVDFDRPKEGRWTHDTQQKLFSGDLGFEYVIKSAQWENNWGQGKKEKPKRPKPGKGNSGNKRR